MLARVAERVYWLSRYMERTENSARLVNVYSNLLLDLPRGTKVGWRTLIDITGIHELFDENHESADERQVIKYLLADKNNPSSLINSLALARENARTTREIMPSEAWELINDLYHYTKENTNKGIGRTGRHAFLNKIINASQQLTGLLAGSVSHDRVYDFVVLGRNIERADMTSRIIDTGAANLSLSIEQLKDEETLPYENSLWMSVLRSLSAYQMYRQHVHDRVNGDDVVDFLLRNADFPRAVLHCLQSLTNAIERLPNNEESLRVIAGLQRRVSELNIEKILRKANLHEFIDSLQADIADVHNAVSKTWFLPVTEA